MEVKVEVGEQVGADAAGKPTTESDPIQSWPNKPPEAKHVLPQQVPSPNNSQRWLAQAQSGQGSPILGTLAAASDSPELLNLLRRPGRPACCTKGLGGATT